MRGHEAIKKKSIRPRDISNQFANSSYKSFDDIIGGVGLKPSFTSFRPPIYKNDAYPIGNVNVDVINHMICLVNLFEHMKNHTVHHSIHDVMCYIKNHVLYDVICYV